jgi:hypothetical protein
MLAALDAEGARIGCDNAYSRGCRMTNRRRQGGGPKIQTVWAAAFLFTEHQYGGAAMPKKKQTPTTTFFKGVAARLAEFAKIPSPNSENFFRKIDFYIICWVVECGGGPKREARDFSRVLSGIKGAATRLLHQLERVRCRLEEARASAKLSDRQDWWTQLLFTAHSADLGVLKHAQSEVIAEAINALSALTASLNDMAPLRRGRLRGAEAYPGLAELVFGLEREARLMGGRFTLNKRYCKGTLIDALDWLRKCCLAESEWKWIAHRLPQPNQHPVAVYEAALHQARIEARKDAQITRKLEA